MQSGPCCCSTAPSDATPQRAARAAAACPPRHRPNRRRRPPLLPPSPFKPQLPGDHLRLLPLLLPAADLRRGGRRPRAPRRRPPRRLRPAGRLWRALVASGRGGRHHARRAGVGCGHARGRRAQRRRRAELARVCGLWRRLGHRAVRRVRFGLGWLLVALGWCRCGLGCCSLPCALSQLLTSPPPPVPPPWRRFRAKRAAGLQLPLVGGDAFSAAQREEEQRAAQFKTAAYEPPSHVPPPAAIVNAV